MFPAVAEYTRVLKVKGQYAKKIMSLERAEKQVIDILAQGTEEANQKIISDLTRRSNLGNQLARKRLVRLISTVLLQHNINVKGFSTTELAKKIYAEAYGLSIIQDIYDDPKVEEVFWNKEDRIFKVINNEIFSCKIKFNSEKHSMKILKRLTRASYSGEASQSNPIGRTSIDDGTRVSWRIPPRSTHVAVNLRKHVSNKHINAEDYIKKGIVSKEVLTVIKALAIANAAVGLIGSGGTGKTTMLKLILAMIHEHKKPRMFVIERIRELRLAEFLREIGFEDENIVEVEEGPEADLDKLFQNAMQAFAQLLVQGEILGWEEVANMLNVYRRGHSAGFFTGHAYPWDLPETLATLYCEAKAQNIDAVTKSMYQVLDGSIYLAKTPKYPRKVVAMYEYFVDDEGRCISRPFYEYDIEKGLDKFYEIQSQTIKNKLQLLKYTGNIELYKKLYDLGLLKKEG